MWKKQKQDVSNRNRVQPGTKDSAGRKGGQFAPETSGRNAPNTKPSIPAKAHFASAKKPDWAETYPQDTPAPPSTITPRTPCVATQRIQTFGDVDHYGVFWVDGEFRREVVASNRWEDENSFIPSVNADAVIKQKYALWRETQREKLEAELEEMKQRIVKKGTVVKGQDVKSSQSIRQGVVEEVVQDDSDWYSRYGVAKVRAYDGSRFSVLVVSCLVQTSDDTWEECVLKHEVEDMQYAWGREHPEVV